jgi:tetratricopeptide (TPR) repeat protein
MSWFDMRWLVAATVLSTIPVLSAWAFEIGDQVVCIRDGAEIRSGNMTVDTAFKGQCLAVVEARDDALWVTANKGGWISTKSVVSLNQAVEFFTVQLKKGPRSPALLNSRGLSFKALGELDKAIADFDEAIVTDSNDPAFFINRGNIYVDKKQYDRAVKDFDVAVKLDPQSAVAYNDRGGAWEFQHQYAKAVADYDTAIKLDPGYTLAFNNLGWLYASATDPQFRSGQKALEYTQAACKATDWKYWLFLGSLAAAYAEAGQFDDAVKWQAKNLELAPESEKEDSRQTLAWYRRGKPYHEKPQR